MEPLARTGLTVLLTLNLARVPREKTGRLQLRPQFGVVLDQCLRMLRERAAENGVRIISHLPQQGASLRADARMVSQVLINLLSNAIKFTRQNGAVVVSVRSEADGSIWLKVEDNGIGIASDDLPKVREPFVQVASAFSREHEGTGLGLPLVDQIMRLHGGSFDIESELGKGTVAKVCFPATRIVAAPNCASGSIEYRRLA